MSNWVWYSTEVSRTEDKVSILAIAETLFFVLLTWGVAFYNNFYYYLFLPLVLTPFLMLKTPKSIEDSHYLFLNKVKIQFFSLRSSLTYYSWLLSSFIGFIIVFSFFTTKQTYIQISIFSIVFFINFFLIKILLIREGKDIVVETVQNAVKETKIIQYIFTTLFIIIGFFVLDVHLGQYNIIAMFFATFLSMSITESSRVAIALVLSSLLIKLFVTLDNLVKRPIDTLSYLPNNFLEQVFINDSCYTPELLPAIRKYNNELQLIGFIRSDMYTKNVVEYLVRFIIIIIWSFTYLYRWSIKSTAWFYWPLAFVFNKKPLEDKIKAKTFIDDQTNPLILKGHIVIGSILLIYFMGSIISLDKLGNVESSVEVIAELFRSIAINHPIVKTIIQPETWWLVAGATIIYFVLYGFSTRQQHRRSHNNPEYSESFNTILHWVIRLKNVLWITFFTINLFFITNQHVWPLIFKYF